MVSTSKTAGKLDKIEGKMEVLDYYFLWLGVEMGIES